MAAPSVLNRLQSKYVHLSKHIKNVGIKVFIVTKIYDHYIGLRLKAMGISYNNAAASPLHAVVESALKDAHENQPSSFYAVKNGLSAVPLPHAQISLLDIGCGNGKILNFGMLLQLKAVTGIELDESALEKAISNCNKMQQKGYSTPFNITGTDAVNYIIPESVNVIYLFNPFGSQTMQKVAANIAHHAKQSHKDVYIIYCMPSFEYVFEAQDKCTKLFEIYNKNKSQKELTVLKIAAGE